MLGIVTVDDIIDVIDDEAQSDYSGLAGVNTDNVNQNQSSQQLNGCLGLLPSSFWEWEQRV
jgi:Mg/Co/Ni transporter MgtE